MATKLSSDHQFVKNPNSAPAVLWSLTKSGKTVTLKEIKAAFKAAGVRGSDEKEYYSSKQFKNRVYWFDTFVQELGFETEQSIDDDKQLTAIKLIKSEKPAKKTKKVKPLAKSAKKAAKPKSKTKKRTSKKVESESESDEPAESEDESEAETSDESEE